MVAVHWNGFIDTESGIQKYTWCVGTTNDMAECSVMDWVDVGLHVSASRKLSSAVTQGNILYYYMTYVFAFISLTVVITQGNILYYYMTGVFTLISLAITIVISYYKTL